MWNTLNCLSNGPFFGTFPGRQLVLVRRVCTWMQMSTDHWWNDTDRRKPKYSEKTLFFASLSTTDLMWTDGRIEPDPPRWEADDESPEPWHGQYSDVHLNFVLTWDLTCGEYCTCSLWRPFTYCYVRKWSLCIVIILRNIYTVWAKCTLLYRYILWGLELLQTLKMLITVPLLIIWGLNTNT